MFSLLRGFSLSSSSLLLALNFNSAFCCCSRGVLPGEDLLPGLLCLLLWVIGIEGIWSWFTDSLKNFFHRRPWTGNAYIARRHTGCGYQLEMTDIHIQKNIYRWASQVRTPLKPHAVTPLRARRGYKPCESASLRSELDQKPSDNIELINLKLICFVA